MDEKRMEQLGEAEAKAPPIQPKSNLPEGVEITEDLSEFDTLVQEQTKEGVVYIDEKPLAFTFKEMTPAEIAVVKGVLYEMTGEEIENTPLETARKIESEYEKLPQKVMEVRELKQAVKTISISVQKPKFTQARLKEWQKTDKGKAALLAISNFIHLERTRSIRTANLFREVDTGQTERI